MGRAKQNGPCICGRPLGEHTQRAARRHREQWLEMLGMAEVIGIVAGVGRALFQAFGGADRFAGELQSAVIEASGYEVSRE